MATISCDQSNSWNHPRFAHTATGRHVPRSDRAVEAATEWEFSDAMRSPRFPAAWFVLPSAAVGCLLLFVLLH